MATIEKALVIAATAHEGQRDKEGLPYILHSLRVMDNVDGEDAKIVAIFHDVVEDTSVSIEDIRRAGFAEAILAAVLCVTHSKDTPYSEYVIRCKGNPIARQVKLADLLDNARLSRTILRPDRLESDLARIHRYALSYKFLTDQMTEHDYRTLMEQVG